MEEKKQGDTQLATSLQKADLGVKADLLTLEVVQANPTTELKVGQKIVIKPSDIGDKEATLGRQAKDGPAHIVSFGKDKSISKKLGNLIYKFDQFGLQAYPSQTAGLQWLIPSDRRYQLNIDSIINIDNTNYQLQIQNTYPNTQIQGQDQLVYSTTIAQLSEATIPLSSYAGKLDDMSKPQVVIKVFEPKTREEKTFNLSGTSLEKDQEFTIGSDDDIVVPGTKKGTAKIGYNKSKKFWYIIANQSEQRLFMMLSTNYQQNKQINSSYYRLADNMQFACGKGLQNVLKVKIN